MDKKFIYKNVIEICKEEPSSKYSYAVLVRRYWAKFNQSCFFGGESEFLTSPESICRAFRTLVKEGKVRLTKTDIVRRKALAEKNRRMLCVK